MDDPDPTISNPSLYRTIFENDRVRVLEHTDKPGDRTTPHRHPDSVMYTLSKFNRRLAAEGKQVDVELETGSVRWLAERAGAFRREHRHHRDSRDLRRT